MAADDINWRWLSQAISFYEKMGWKYVEVPWTVPRETMAATCPDENLVVSSDIGFLVGSSEQSFLHLDLNGLGKGKFVACTPCFRNDVVDDLHRKTFMKVELYRNDVVDGESLEDMMCNCMSFFASIVPMDYSKYLTISATGKESFDIDLCGIEIGSYGTREWHGLRWVYGTGIAEPRFSKALAFIK